MFIKLSEIKTKKAIQQDGEYKSPRQIRDDFVDFLNTICIDYFIFCDPTVPDYFYVEKESAYTNYPAFLIDYYIEKGYFDVDPIMDIIENLDKEYFIIKDIIEEVKKTKELTSLEKKYFHDLKSMGFHNSLTIKFQDPLCTLDILAFAEDTEKIYLKHKQEIIQQFMSYRTTLMNVSTQKPKVIFSEKERECLSWIAQGKTAWEVSKIMGISQRTVNAHINSFIKKLDANSRTHAVAIAIEKKLITIE